MPSARPPHRWHRPLRYLMTGCLNTCLAYAYFFAIFSLAPTSGIARINLGLYGSLLISSLTSYQLQKQFVWHPGFGRRRGETTVEQSQDPTTEKDRKSNYRIVTFSACSLSLVFISAQITAALEHAMHADPRISQLIITPPLSVISYVINRKIFTSYWR